MAFNKTKALESALKFLSQGKTAQAIAEYQQILRQDAKDQATLMTVGDLYARQGDMAHAIEYFERLAQVYLNDGFNSKAIAIYKKIAKLAPAELAPLERLADLYVQQGVLSEARPLFLQIAEAYLKANHGPKAVEVLRRLLEVEPENPRVQMRLAELYNAMGHKKEAAQTYYTYALRLSDRGDAEESQKLLDRTLELEPQMGAALFLKAKILAGAHKEVQAIAILENHPDADAGGEVTILLVDLHIQARQVEDAADRARNQLVRGNSHFGLLLRVTDTVIESEQAADALPLLRELRDPMIDAGEHDKFLKSLSRACEKMPGQTEPLEMKADFCRHTSDPFHLTDALTKLADVYVAQGNQVRAEAALEELIERNKNDERLVARLQALRGGQDIPAPLKREPPAADPEVSATEEQAALEPGLAEAPLAPAAIEEPELDEETQRYVAQALTDVDLFSSYGLTQKAVNLLENVLQRAPRHTPTLERLLDMHLGAGSDRRTAELAARLELISRERGDQPSVERFAELRERFQKAAGVSTEELRESATLPPASESAIAPVEEGAPAEEMFDVSSPAEFEIPLEPLDPEVVPEAVSVEKSQEIAAAQAPSSAPGEELDLSDEWEAMVLEVAEPQPTEAEAAQAQVSEQTHAKAETSAGEAVSAPAESAEALGQEETPAAELAPLFEVRDTPDVVTPEPTAEAESGEMVFELTPELEQVGGEDNTTTEEFISELAAEFDGLEPIEIKVTEAPKDSTREVVASARSETTAPPEPSLSDAERAAGLNELAEVFQEFRSEMGELGQEEDEDLETHYNLGIAYREMGLFEEAIGEFQKVASAIQKGKPFRYAMNCSTLLGLTFLEKGEPKIAAVWYERALEVPGLDAETVLALRYDLAVALEMAGEAEAALDSFRRVYAINIEYRDVADHIAALQHP